MLMKTNMPVKSETHERIQQMKLGVDWHADHYRVGVVVVAGPGKENLLFCRSLAALPATMRQPQLQPL
jgi:hypothetical protein